MYSSEGVPNKNEQGVTIDAPEVQIALMKTWAEENDLVDLNGNDLAMKWIQSECAAVFRAYVEKNETEPISLDDTEALKDLLRTIDIPGPVN